METEKNHKTKFMEFAVYLKSQYDSIFPMPAGACNLCTECTYPDNPCRYPTLASPSMEAAGLFVSDICRKNNVEILLWTQDNLVHQLYSDPKEIG